MDDNDLWLSVLFNGLENGKKGNILVDMYCLIS